MNLNELAQLPDDELIRVVEQNKPSPLVDAFLIGFLVGILIYSAAATAWGLVSLIPLFMIYLFLKKPKRCAAQQKELQRRNLA